MAKQPSNNQDDQSANATQAVVTDAMRTDILGPNMVNVILNHTPTSEAIQTLIAKSISDEPDVKNIKKALGGFLDDYDTKRKGKWVERIIALVTGAVVTGIIALLISRIH